LFKLPPQGATPLNATEGQSKSDSGATGGATLPSSSVLVAANAVVAVDHSLLVEIYYMIKHGHSYTELGADYLDKLELRRLKRYLISRLERLG
jgi:hypothetical protein